MQSGEATKQGQRVLIDPVAHPELTWQQLGRPYEIVEIDGDGDDAKLRLKDDGGRIVKWIRVDELLPAPARPGERPRVVEVEPKEQPPMQNLEADVLTVATRYHSQGDPWDVAARKAGSDVLGRSTEKHDAYRGVSPREPVMSLSSRSTEREVSAEIQRVADERGISFAEAGDLIIATGRAVQFKERVMKLVAAGHNASAALNLAQQEDPEGATAWREAGLN